MRIWSVIGAAALLALTSSPSASAQTASAQQLTPAQTIKTSDMTPKELAYYNRITDPAVATNFIITRSYVRLCQAVVDKQAPAEQLPDKPLGFSAAYLLPGEATMINAAIAASIVAMCHSDPQGCLGGQ